MGTKVGQVICMIDGILESYSVQFSNISKLDGQHDKYIETAAKVLSSQFSSKKKLYANFFQEIINSEEAFDDEALETMKHMLKAHKVHKKSRVFTHAKEVIEYAIKSSEINVNIINKLEELIDKSPHDRTEILNFAGKIKIREEKNMATLQSFIQE